MNLDSRCRRRVELTLVLVELENNAGEAWTFSAPSHPTRHFLPGPTLSTSTIGQFQCEESKDDYIYISYWCVAQDQFSISGKSDLRLKWSLFPTHFATFPARFRESWHGKPWPGTNVGWCPTGFVPPHNWETTITPPSPASQRLPHTDGPMSISNYANEGRKRARTLF